MENDSFPRFLRSTYYKGVSSRRGPLESLLGTLLSSRNSSDSHRTAGVNDSTRISNSRNNNNNNSVSNEASLSRALTSGNSKLSPHYTTDDVAKVVRALCEPTAVHWAQWNTSGSRVSRGESSLVAHAEVVAAQTERAGLSSIDILNLPPSGYSPMCLLKTRNTPKKVCSTAPPKWQSCAFVFPAEGACAKTFKKIVLPRKTKGVSIKKRTKPQKYWCRWSISVAFTVKSTNFCNGTMRGWCTRPLITVLSAKLVLFIACIPFHHYRFFFRCCMCRIAVFFTNCSR